MHVRLTCAALGAFVLGGCWSYTTPASSPLIVVSEPSPLFADGRYCMIEIEGDDEIIGVAPAGDCYDIRWDAAAGHHLLVNPDASDPAGEREEFPLLWRPAMEGQALVQTLFGGDSDGLLYFFAVARPGGFAMATSADADIVMALAGAFGVEAERGQYDAVSVTPDDPARAIDVFTAAHVAHLAVADDADARRDDDYVGYFIQVADGETEEAALERAGPMVDELEDAMFAAFD